MGVQRNNNQEMSQMRKMG